MDTADTKTCTKCEETKPLDAFRKQKDCRGGLRADCKACCLTRERAWKAAHSELVTRYFADRYAAQKDTLRAQQKIRYLADRERILSQQRDYYARTKEQRRAAARRYAAENRDAAQERAQRNYRKNPDRYKDHAALRRARLRSVTVERISRLEVLARSHGRCGICGHTIDGTFHVDHIVPVSLGGAHAWYNVQAAHPACNLAKKANLEGQIHLPV